MPALSLDDIGLGLSLGTSGLGLNNIPATTVVVEVVEVEEEVQQQQ